METRDIALIKALSNGAGGASYTLPIASSAVLGGVKPTEKTDSMTQAVGVDEAGGLWTAPGGGGGESDLVEIANVSIAEDVLYASIDLPSGQKEILIHTFLKVSTEDGTAWQNLEVDLYLNGLKSFIKTPISGQNGSYGIWLTKIIGDFAVGYAYLAGGASARSPYANDWPRTSAELGGSITSIKFKPTTSDRLIKAGSRIRVFGRP